MVNERSFYISSKHIEYINGNPEIETKMIIDMDFFDSLEEICDTAKAYLIFNNIKTVNPVSYTHLTLPTTPYV